MALKIVKIPAEKYKPIQEASQWQEKTMYICKKINGTAEIYIEGQNCGSFYDDTDIQNKIVELQNAYDNIQYLTNIDLERILT